MNQGDFHSNSQQESKKMSIELEHRYENIIEDLRKQSNNLRYKIPKTSERKRGVVGVIGHW
jgi:phosphoenolpyruvate carboxylase